MAESGMSFENLGVQKPTYRHELPYSLVRVSVHDEDGVREVGKIMQYLQHRDDGSQIPFGPLMLVSPSSLEIITSSMSWQDLIEFASSVAILGGGCNGGR